MRIQVDMLGQFRVSVDDRVAPPADWRRERSAALVKLLALSGGRRLHREQAMEALWPEMSPDASAANLRKAVHFARRALGVHDLIGLSNDIVSLAPGDELIVDAERFEAAAKAALHGATAGRSACERVAELYGGELLPDDRYVEWTEEPRERLRQLYARVLRAGGLWERLLAVDATDEEAQRAMMQAALDAGNRGEVIRQFQRLRERLRADLGVGPAAATIAIYERALNTPSKPSRSPIAFARRSPGASSISTAASSPKRKRSPGSAYARSRGGVGARGGRGQRAVRARRAHAGQMARAVPIRVHKLGPRVADVRLDDLRRAFMSRRVLSVRRARP